MRDSTFAIRGMRRGLVSPDGTCEPEGELVATSPQIGVIALNEEAVYWTAQSITDFKSTAIRRMKL
jgi:hypothetical protein